MSQSVEPSSTPPREAREPRSTLYVLASAVIAALILGLTIFLLVRGFQWRAALADLRAEPGIEILSIERAGFFKKRLLGLRDPLAPTVESLLRKRNIGDHSVEVVLTEYHSLNTPYAKAREEREQARFDDLRQSVLSAVGEFAATTAAQREEDLEKITQILFEARFPEEMKTVKLEKKDDTWIAKGELYAPAHESFVAEAPAYLVEGELLFNQLVNRTENRTSSIRQDVESSDLLAVDLDGIHVHLDRIRRLVADYDEVCRASGLPEPRLQLEIVAADPGAIADRIEAVKRGLTSPGGLAENRFLPNLPRKQTPDQPPGAFLKLIPLPARR